MQRGLDAYRTRITTQASRFCATSNHPRTTQNPVVSRILYKNVAISYPITISRFSSCYVKMEARRVSRWQIVMSYSPLRSEDINIYLNVLTFSCQVPLTYIQTQTKNIHVQTHAHTYAHTKLSGFQTFNRQSSQARPVSLVEGKRKITNTPS